MSVEPIGHLSNDHRLGLVAGDVGVGDFLPGSVGRALASDRLLTGR
jgi:hypothetical protein